MRRMTVLGLAAGSVLLAVACGGAKVCTPGQSLFCAGPNACVGFQVCNAEGTAVGACNCSGADAGTDAGTPDAGPPTEGALRTVWSLTRGGAAVTCGATGAASISVIFTESGSANAFNRKFACPAAASMGTAEALNIPFATYAVIVSAFDDGGLALGSAPAQNVTFDDTNCTPVIQGDCGRIIAPVIDVP